MTISRRKWIMGGAAALGGASLWGTRSPARADVVGPKRNLLLVVASGGWDTTYALDPKPGLTTIDAPAGSIRSFGNLDIYVDATRPAVDEFFEAYGDVTAVVRGLQTQSIVHSDCAKRVLTGTASDQNPDIGAITAYELGRDLPAPYLVLGQTSYTGSLASIAARAGTANQLGTLLGGDFRYPTDAGLAPFEPDVSEVSLIRDYVRRRAEDDQSLRGLAGENARRMQDFVDSIDRGDRLAELADFGDFEYTRDLVVQSGLALDAIEQDLSWAVQMEFGDWDTHSGNAMQGDLHQQLYTGLKLLLDDLAARPGRNPGNRMLDETVVAVVSEMGRTPKLNENVGKDHWPVTSAMVIGAGVSGGETFGATNDLLEAQSVDMLTGQVSGNGKQLQYGNFAAGLLNLVGVDSATHLPNSEAFHAICA